MKTRILFLHALSPLHAGTGQGVGVIDLPIAREKATGIPYLPGSSVKGTLRDTYRAKGTKDKCEQIFGPETISDNDGYAGAIQISDQRLLLLPIRSLAGTFAWVTSPYLLKRFRRDLIGAGITGLPKDVPEPDLENCVTVKGQCKIGISSETSRVFLEDVELEINSAQDAKVWAEKIANWVFASANEAEWRRMMIERFCIVSDNVFNFLLGTATEITARIKLQDDAKTVQKGGLWYEEALPVETILTGLVLAIPNNRTKLDPEAIFKVIDGLIVDPLQFGGKATVGRGVCRLSMS